MSNTKFLFLLSNKNLSHCKIISEGISLKPLDLISIVKFLKRNKQLLLMATAMDQPYKINRFSLQYVFIDFLIANRFYISFNVNLHAPSLTNYFSSSIWLEREIYDMYGIYFTTSYQSDLRRLLTDYHFKGHPFRKDFTLIGYTEKVYSFGTKTIKTKKDIIF
jgi:NADH:ubiquinone oxidoreductase subunit C